MELLAYLEREKVRQSAFARKIGVTPAAICRILKGSRNVGPHLALAIDAATDGEVSKSAMRPDLWPPEATP